MKVTQSLRQDEFENVLLAELQELRRTEKALQKMYPRLKSKPQLRNSSCNSWRTCSSAHIVWTRF